jgi:hypothetical protein
MHDVNSNLIEKLDEIASQGRENASNLKLIRSQLFGSEEDHFKAGRLPVLERSVAGIHERIDEIEKERAVRQGQSEVIHPALRVVGRLLVGGLTALGGAIVGARFHH